MGTNYYLTNSDGTPGRHIGKSSAGWCFALHVYPEDDIRTLSDWIPDLMHGSIQDEYGEGVCFETMLKIICDRRWKGDVPQRHEIGNGCIGNGTGSWDLIAVDFS